LTCSRPPSRGWARSPECYGDGSEYLFTLLFAPDADETAVEAQMAVVDQELEAVRALCEPAA